MTLGLSRSSTALLFAVAAVSVFAFTARPAEAATRTWDGGGSTNNWNEAANWSSNSTPTAADVAVFNGTSTKNATINTNISVSGIDINSGYTGTITQASGSTVTVGTGDFDISAGTFVGGDSAITMNDLFTISGGSFTSTSATLHILGNWTITSGSFSHNGGSISTTGSGHRTWNVATTVTVNDLTLDRNHGYMVTISSGDTIVVDGDLTLSNGIVNTGTLDVREDVAQGLLFDGGSAVISFGNDALAQDYAVIGGEVPKVRFDDPDDASDELIYNTATYTNEINITSGFSGTVPITNTNDSVLTFQNWVQAAGDYDASAQSSLEFASFVRTGGTFTAPNLVTAVLGGPGSWDVDTSQTFVNLTIDRTISNHVDMGAGDVFVVTGDLTLAGGLINNGTVDVRGNIVQGTDFDGGDATIDFGENGVAQTYTVNGGQGPIIRFDHPDDGKDLLDFAAAASFEQLVATSGFSGSIPLTNGSDATLTFGVWDQDGGTYDASAQSQWNIKSFLNTTNGSFVAPQTVVANSTVGTWDVDGSQNFENLIVDKTNGNQMQIGSGDTLVVMGDLTLTNGIANTGTIDVRGDMSQGLAFDGGTAVVEFGDDAVAQTFTVNGGVTTVLEFDDADDASDSLVFAAPAVVSELRVTSGFAGTLPISNTNDDVLSFTLWNQAAGSYDASAQTAWNVRAMTLSSGATFVAPALVTAYSSSGSWDVDTTQTFADFTVAKNNGNQVTMGAGDIFVISGDLTLTDGIINGGVFDVMGNVTQASTFDGGTAVVSFADDAVAQTYTINGGLTPGIRLDDADDANDDIDMVVNSTLSSFVVTSGFSGNVPLNNPSDFVLTFSYLEMGGGTWDASAQTAWNIVSTTMTGGTFTAPDLVTASGVNGGYDFNPSQAFENFTVNRTSSLAIASGDTLIVTGLLTLTNGSATTGTLEPQANVVVQSTWDGGSGILRFGGSATQSFDLTGATGLYNGDIKVNKTGGQVNLASDLVMDFSGQDLVIEEGVFSLGGRNLTVNGGGSAAIVVEDGGTFRLIGSETIVKNSGQPTTQVGSTVEYTGDGDSAADSYSLTSLTASYGGNLLINSTDGATDTFTLGAALNVDGNLTNNGSLDVTASNYAINLGGNWTNTGAFNAQAGSVILDGGNQSLSGNTTFYNLTKAVAAAATLTFVDNGSTYAVANTTTLTGVSGQLLSLRSSNSGQDIDFDPQGSDVLEYLDVQDNNNIDANAAVCLTGTCVDSGNNTNWTF